MSPERDDGPERLGRRAGPGRRRWSSAPSSAAPVDDPLAARRSGRGSPRSRGRPRRGPPSRRARRCVSSYSRAFWIADADIRGDGRQQPHVVIAEAALLRGALDADHADRLVAGRIGTPRYDFAGVPTPRSPSGRPIRGVDSAAAVRRLVQDPRGQARRRMEEAPAGRSRAVLAVVGELDQRPRPASWSAT